MEKVRVLRILEYVGDRDWVEKTLQRSSVPLNGQIGVKKGIIKSAIVGDFPEILGKEGTGQIGPTGVMLQEQDDKQEPIPKIQLHNNEERF